MTQSGISAWIFFCNLVMLHCNSLYYICALALCLCSTSFSSELRDVHSHVFPTLGELLGRSNYHKVSAGKSQGLLSSSELTSSALKTSSIGNGLVYLEFYPELSCAGSVTYSTGINSGMCLPANNYVRPPFADDDEFYYKFPFQSFRIDGVTGTEWFPLILYFYCYVVFFFLLLLILTIIFFTGNSCLWWVVHNILHRCQLHRHL